jgi:hypothetical protein
LADKKAVIGGKESDLCYKDCQAEIDLINRAFLEVMLEGDADGRGFAYPIPTYNITKDFNWDGENADLLFQMTAKYGTPYFQNFVNSDLNPSDVRSMCCRLQLDKRELRRRGGGLHTDWERTRHGLHTDWKRAAHGRFPYGRTTGGRRTGNGHQTGGGRAGIRLLPTFCDIPRWAAAWRTWDGLLTGGRRTAGAGRRPRTFDGRRIA